MTIIQSGKIAKLKKNNSLLISTAADIMTKNDESDDKPQNNSSVYGKILEIDLKSHNY